MTDKVLLCVTLKTDLWPAWFMDFNNIQIAGKGFSAEVLQVYDFRADEARNKALWQFHQQKQFSHLLFLDSDVTIPPDTIPRLLAHKKDIVGGLYMLKAFPFPPTMYTTSPLKPEDAGGEHLVDVILDYKRGSMMKVDALATGCMMLSRRVLNLPRPWFSFKEGGTEDIYFCRHAINNGFEIWCDTSIECGHLRVAKVSVGDYWARVQEAGGVEKLADKVYEKEWKQAPWLEEDKDAVEGEFGEVAGEPASAA